VDDYELDPVQYLRGEYESSFNPLQQEVFAAIDKLATETKTMHNDNFECTNKVDSKVCMFETILNEDASDIRTLRDQVEKL
jgi:hypothetical protein